MRRIARIVIWAVAIAAVIVLLFTVVFPRVERLLEDPTMGVGHGGAWEAPGTSAASAPGAWGVPVQ